MIWILAQSLYPATPTPLPNPEDIPLEFPDISGWDYTDNAIQTWNSASELTNTFQVIVLVGVLLLVAQGIYLYAQKISSETG